MGQFQRKWDDVQRAAIVDLKSQGLSGREVSERMAAGWSDLEPFEISGESVNQLYRDHRRRHAQLTVSELAKMPAGAAVRTLFERAVATADRASAQLDRDVQRGKMDMRAFGAFTRSLIDLEKVARSVQALDGAKPAKKADTDEEPEPDSLASRLAADETPTEAADDVGDVRLGANGGRLGARRTETEDAPTSKGPTETGQLLGAHADLPHPNGEQADPSLTPSSTPAAQEHEHVGEAGQGSGRQGTRQAKPSASTLDHARAREIIETAAASARTS